MYFISVPAKSFVIPTLGDSRHPVWKERADNDEENKKNMKGTTL